LIVATPEKIPDGPWGSATDGQKQGWRAKMNPRLRKALLGHQGAIQRLSRLLLKTALITGAACIIPPILGASTVLTLAMTSFFSAAVLGYLSWIHDFIEGRKESANARLRRRALWFGAATYMVGILVVAYFTLPPPPLP
jgi:hypothetical protein